jgi:hypothetical protein
MATKANPVAASSERSKLDDRGRIVDPEIDNGRWSAAGPVRDDGDAPWPPLPAFWPPQSFQDCCGRELQRRSGQNPSEIRTGLLYDIGWILASLDSPDENFGDENFGRARRRMADRGPFQPAHRDLSDRRRGAETQL